MASPWLWCQLLNPDSSRCWGPSSLPEGLSHSHALFFLLCDYVMSRALLDKGGPDVQSMASCWFHRAVDPWAGLSVLRAECPGHHEPPGPAECTEPRGQSSGDRVHKAPAEVQACVLLGLELVGNAILETSPHFALVQELRVCQCTCPSAATHEKRPLASLPAACPGWGGGVLTIPQGSPFLPLRLCV